MSLTHVLQKIAVWLRSAFAVPSFRQTLCNVTTFISIESCIHFCINDRFEPFLQSFCLTPNTLNGVKVTTLVANSCVKMTPHAPWHLCAFKLHSFTTRVLWILALSSWNMPEPSGRRKSFDGITWSFSTFRNSADFQCLDLTNWSNPRSYHYNLLI